LTTKMVDSCQSGLPYIKDNGEIDLYLKGTQSGFQNCYFLFSSHTDEASYQDNVLSAFTRSIGALVSSRKGVIRHKDIIDYVSDSFALDTLQTPFFVVQADFTDQFCKVDEKLQKKIADLLASTAQSYETSQPGETTLKALIEEDAKDYCTKDEAFNVLIKLNAYLTKYKHPAEVQEFYKVEVSKLPEYSSIPNISAIGKWFKENKHTFFAEPIEDKVKVKRLKRGMFGIAAVSFATIGQPTLSDSDYEFVTELRTSGVRSTTELPYVGLLLRAKALYPNLDSTSCFLVPFISRTHMIIFAGPVYYSARGWGEEAILGDVKWRFFEERMKNEDGVLKLISTVISDFWDFTITPVKKKYGLIKEDVESDSGEKTGKKNLGEQKDVRDKK